MISRKLWKIYKKIVEKQREKNISTLISQSWSKENIKRSLEKDMLSHGIL